VILSHILHSAAVQQTVVLPSLFREKAKVKVPFPYPSLTPVESDLRSLFARRSFVPRQALRNPHPEPPVSDAVRQTAKPSAVLLPIVVGSFGLQLLLTRRHQNIRFAGHICFPGGRQDPEDLNAVQTALRETEEEIGLEPDAVEVLGELGHYFTQTGYEIVPVVGLIQKLPELAPNPAEVDQIYLVPLNTIFDVSNYQLRRHESGRGHLSYHHHSGSEHIRVAGPTVSLMVALYEHQLLDQNLISQVHELQVAQT